jgi:hypothetical protein
MLIRMISGKAEIPITEMRVKTDFLLFPMSCLENVCVREYVSIVLFNPLHVLRVGSYIGTISYHMTVGPFQSSPSGRQLWCLMSCMCLNVMSCMTIDALNVTTGHWRLSFSRLDLQSGTLENRLSSLSLCIK